MSRIFDLPLTDALEATWRGLLARAEMGALAPRAPMAGDDSETMEFLYGPLVQADALVLGQMGQSLDGFIATRTGHSHYVTGPESLVHLHRLRALVDAVVVGSATVVADDPRLTVRRVEGADPVRVVVDLDRSLDGDVRAFAGGADVLRVVADGLQPQRGGVPELAVRAVDGALDPHELVRGLAGRGLRRILVEGGGRLVSSFLRARALDRLHVAVAPLLVGGGVPGVVPEPVDSLENALRPSSRTYAMGVDVLFDLDVGSSTPSRST
ncbi:MAG: RibD family protein [Planctomycetota bacterium]